MYLFILEYLFESRPFDVFDYAFRSLEKLFNQTGLSVFVDRFFPVCGTYGNQNIQSALNTLGFSFQRLRIARSISS